MKISENLRDLIYLNFDIKVQHAPYEALFKI